MLELAAAENGDFYFVDAADAEEGVRKLLAIVRERIPKRFGFDTVRDIQVLCPMNRGGLGARWSKDIDLKIGGDETQQRIRTISDRAGPRLR